MWLPIFLIAPLLVNGGEIGGDWLAQRDVEVYERCVNSHGGEQTCVFAINALRIARANGVDYPYHIDMRVPVPGLVVFELSRLDQRCSYTPDQCVIARHAYYVGLSRQYDRGVAQATAHRGIGYGPMVWASLRPYMR